MCVPRLGLLARARASEKAWAGWPSGPKEGHVEQTCTKWSPQFTKGPVCTGAVVNCARVGLELPSAAERFFLFQLSVVG